MLLFLRQLFMMHVCVCVCVVVVVVIVHWHCSAQLSMFNMEMRYRNEIIIIIIIYVMKCLCLVSQLAGYLSCVAKTFPWKIHANCATRSFFVFCCFFLTCHAYWHH